MEENIIIPPQRPKSSAIYYLIALVLLLILGGIAYLLFSKSSEDKPPQAIDTPTPSVSSSLVPTNISDTVSANNYFGLNLLKQIGYKKDNIFISPTSITMALTLAANGAEGKSLEEMLNVLGLDNVGLAKANSDANAKMTKFNNSSEDLKISLANSIWTTKDYNFLPAFKTLAENTFLAKADKANSEKEINKWVETKTNGKIKNILNSLESELYLVNAIYFKGKWMKQFSGEATKKESFASNSGNVEVEMMRQEDGFGYFEDEATQIVKLPYESEDANNSYSMIVFLPNKTSSVAKFVAALDHKKYQDYVGKLAKREVDLKLPKFETTYKDEQIKFLQALGMKNPFVGEGLSKIASRNQVINQVIHQSYIKNDELGTEAAAATSVGMVTSAILEPEKPAEMFVDRPFFFTIQNDQTKEMLFTGIIQNPNTK